MTIKSISDIRNIDEVSLAPVAQPDSWEIHCVDGVFVKQMVLREAGLVVPQHSHKYAHTSFLAMGAVRVWAGDELLGDYDAPTGIFIKADQKHTFLSLAPAIVYCIHNLHGMDDVEIMAEHQLGE